MSRRDISLYIILIAIDKINRYTKNIDSAEELLCIRQYSIVGSLLEI